MYFQTSPLAESKRLSTVIFIACPRGAADVHTASALNPSAFVGIQPRQRFTRGPTVSTIDFIEL
jgi:hypothetical protein